MVKQPFVPLHVYPKKLLSLTSDSCYILFPYKVGENFDRKVKFEFYKFEAKPRL